MGKHDLKYFLSLILLTVSLIAQGDSTVTFMTFHETSLSNDSPNIPVHLDPGVFSLGAFQFNINFDPEVVSFQSFTNGDIIPQEGWFIQSNSLGDTAVVIGGFASGGDPIESTGNLVYISWVVNPSAETGDTTPLNFSNSTAGDYNTAEDLPVTTVDGSIEVLGMSTDEMKPAPTSPILYSNNPNPFNSETNIAFYIQTHGNASLHIIDIKGRLMETLINKNLNPGIHEITWNASSYPSGIYLAQLTSNNYLYTQKLIYLK